MSLALCLRSIRRLWDQQQRGQCCGKSAGQAGPSAAVLTGQLCSEKVETVTYREALEAALSAWRELCCAVEGQLVGSVPPGVVHAVWCGPVVEAMPHRRGGTEPYRRWAGPFRCAELGGFQKLEDGVKAVAGPCSSTGAA